MRLPIDDRGIKLDLAYLDSKIGYYYSVCIFPTDKPQVYKVEGSDSRVLLIVRKTLDALPTTLILDELQLDTRWILLVKLSRPSDG